MESLERTNDQGDDRALRRRRLSRSIAIGLAGAGLLAISLIVLAGIQGGRSPAERAATSLAMPIALIWLLLFAAALAALMNTQRRWATQIAIAWLTFGVIFNGWVAGSFLRRLEYPAAANPATELTTPLDAVVLLGGYASDNRFDVPELGHDGQRLLFAAQLWHSGKTKTLICTGTGTGEDRDPSLIGRELLTSIGVPDHVIFEVPGVNTDSEMVHLKSFFRAPPDPWLQHVGWPRTEPGSDRLSGGQSIGLVTSAVHLSRAMRLAEKRGLVFTPLGCDFSGGSRDTFLARDLIPSAGAAKAFAIAFKEQLASFVGR